MSERDKGPQIYSIAAHRGFADALVAGLIPRYGDGELGLARLTLLVPSQRALRTITEAFVRAFGAGGTARGLLMPRMAVAGDLDLDEALGSLLDPLGAEEAIAPAANPTRRWLRLAAFITELEGDEAPKGAALLRRAFEAGRTMDRLAVEGVSPAQLLEPDVLAVVGDQARHWIDSTAGFLKLQACWQAELEARGEIDAPVRRNLLLERAARLWSEAPPAHPIVAVGVTSASPALAKLLRVVSQLPRGAVILPDLDLTLDKEVWGQLGNAGMGEGPDDPPFGRQDAVTHPQYHLKLLLNRMGVGREEVQPWHRAGMSAAPPARSRAISSLFLPPAASARWVDLAEPKRRLSGVRLMESAHPGQEAQAIALLMRQALETPEKRVALITPDRGLAGRVVSHLRRWGIAADDTAGMPLPHTAAGRVLLLLAEVMAEQAPPVPLIALLGHPLVKQGEGRAAWLDHVRQLDLALRGPRPGAGLEPLRAIVTEQARRRKNPGLRNWWAEVEAALALILGLPEDMPLAQLLDALLAACEALCGEAMWAGADGRALAAFVEDLRGPAQEVPTRLSPRDLPAVLREAMDRLSVRPPWGGHPRVAIYGLIEARMSRADLVICGGLTEGSWPASPKPDALLPPAVLRHLGVPGGDFRIGLAAHDLAGALGAPEVVLSWAMRDEGGPVIPSRFVLRVQAMLGAELAARHGETEAVVLARDLDAGWDVSPHPQPAPMPSAEQRRVDIAVTALDRLRGDPYQFYAQAILGLKKLDGLDAEPSPAWRGIAVHAILDQWHKAGAPAGRLVDTAADVLDTMSAHPLTRSLWRPRLLAALEWIDQRLLAEKAAGRQVVATEIRGEIKVSGIRIHGRADRIDRLPDGALAVIDYKTGTPPTGKMVADGFALQLGLIGMIADAGGFDGVKGEPTHFEYWSLAKTPKPKILKDKRGPGRVHFGYMEEPVPEGRKRSGIPREDFLDKTAEYLDEAIARWILGNEPFTARLNPDLASYADYDQLMRLEEWLGRSNQTARPDRKKLAVVGEEQA